MQSAPEKRIKHDYALRLRRWTTLPPSRRDKPCLSAPCGRPSQSSRRDKPRLSGLRSKQSPGGRSGALTYNRRRPSILPGSRQRISI
jgi:hypothetical protein